FGRAGGAAGQFGDGRAPTIGDAVHPDRVRAVVFHGRFGPGAVRAAVAGGRVRDDRVVYSFEHVRAGDERVAVAASVERGRDRRRIRPEFPAANGVRVAGPRADEGPIAP